MSAQGLGSRAIIGEFYATLEQALGAGWIDLISMEFDSDQDSETYKWLGMVPQMREWIGGRNAHGFRENGITIENKQYEATLELLTRELRRDKTGQLLVRVRELATRSQAHWASLLSTLIINAEASLCYDGQFFFDTDHSEGDSGVQSNDISVDISALPTTNHGVVTAPAAEEMQQAILQGVQTILGFVDDQGEPMNELASNYIVMVPTVLWHITESATKQAVLKGGETNLIPQTRLDIQPVVNPRLTWTDKFAIFRTDGQVKPFIRQKETEVDLKVKAEGSEYEFDNNAHQYGIDVSRNVGYGYWQHAALVTMV